MKSIDSHRLETMISEENKLAARGLLISKSKPKVKIRLGRAEASKKQAPTSCLKSVIPRMAAILELIMAAVQLSAPCLGQTLPLAQPPSSELSFEYLNLKAIPSGGQLCKLEFQSQVNSVSFANNRIESIGPSAFVCIGLQLKILNLRNNKIESISGTAFEGLARLQVLILEANKLKELPWRQLGALHLPSLRHLNLAHNRIGAIEANETLAGPSLISLNLRANPLKRVHRNSLSGLGKLKTLTLSQLELETSQLAAFGGLSELRFVHLDQLGAHLSAIDGQFCDSSRRLATLDLSYNRIEGALAANFSQLDNLIDLYLGHNRIEHLLEDAFVGLGRLQVLELNANRIKTIHPSAFVPLRATLYELNIANNIQLAALASTGLERLISLKSYGNNQLRELPIGELRSVRLLALTFAYHCCDYHHQNNNNNNNNNHQTTTSARRGSPNDLDGRDKQEAASALGRTQTGSGVGAEIELVPASATDQARAATDELAVSSPFASVLSTLSHLWPFNFLSGGGGATQHTNAPPTVQEMEAARARLHRPDAGQSRETADARNMSEMVLWRPRAGEAVDDDEYFRTLNSRREQQRPPRGRRHASNRREESRPEMRDAAPRPPRSALGERRGAGDEPRAVIDELIWRASKIRSAHLQDGDERAGPIKLEAPDDDGDDDDDDDWLEMLVAGQDGARQTDELEALDLGARAGLVAEALGRTLLESTGGVAISAPAAGASSGHAKRAAQSARAEPIGPEDGRQQHIQQQAPNAVQCLPRPDAFQPCRDLFDSVWLRASISLVFLFAFAGNILVIVVLSSVKPSSSTSALTSIMWFNAAQSKRHIDVPRFLVINLAVADLLMAAYLGLLAFTDLSTLGEFRLHAIEWQYSTGCQLAGFLAVLSSELSVFILAIITLERNYAITNAVHLNRRLSLQKAMVVMFFGYVYALCMALLPLNGVNDYRKYSICLPLDFDSANLLAPSSLYLISLITVNTLSFALLLGCYLRMYFAIRGSQAWSTNDLKIAKRMSILVATDFLCWSPIICAAIMSLFGHYLVGPEGLKVLIIFVLPLNSVANPFLYAITTKKFKRDLATLKKRLRIEEARQGLARACGHLGHPFAHCSNTMQQQQQAAAGGRLQAINRGSASWTVRGGETGAHPNARLVEPVLCKVAGSKTGKQQVNSAKRGATEYKLAADEVRAARAKQQQQQQRTTKREVLLVHQNGRSTSIAAAHARLLQLRPACDKHQTLELTSADERPALATQCKTGHRHRAASQAKCAACARHHATTIGPQVRIEPMIESSGSLDLAQQQLPQPQPQQRAHENLQRQLSKPTIVLQTADEGAALETTSASFAVRTCEHELHRRSPCCCAAERAAALMRPAPDRMLSASDTIRQDQRPRAAVVDDEDAGRGRREQQRARSADKSPSPRERLLSLVVSHVGKQRESLDDADLHAQLSIGANSPHSSGAIDETVGSDSQRRVSELGDLLRCNHHHHHRRRHDHHHDYHDHHDHHLHDPGYRSVSACAFEWPPPAAAALRLHSERGHVGGADYDNQICSIHRNNSARVNSVRFRPSSSAAAKSTLAASTSGHSMSQRRAGSISRFVFRPLAKAWLSLQLGQSKATSASNVAVETLHKHSYGQRAIVVEGNHLGQQGRTDESLLEQVGAGRDSASEIDELLLLDFHEGSIVDDVLQMSSPKRKQLLRGRRMSRSCDAVPAESSTTTTTTLEPTSSSLYDQHDDQRILLATISQLKARRRRRHKKVPEMAGARKLPKSDQSVGGRRRVNCTRCRSWSPALLHKLEDCMHQIRARMPKFGEEQRVRAKQHQHQPSSFDTGSQLRIDDEALDAGHNMDAARHDRAGPSSPSSHCTSVSASSSSSSSSSLSLFGPIEDEEEEEDRFDEVGPNGDWTRGRRVAPPSGHKKPASRRGRLRQQMSGNSDTLSAKTVGTTLTSLSFDSSSNIPANLAGSIDNAVQAIVEPTRTGAWHDDGSAANSNQGELCGSAGITSMKSGEPECCGAKRPD